MTVTVTPPGEAERSYALQRPTWRAEVPASVGPAGVWRYRFHVRGVWANGEPAEADSPEYQYPWTVRSPAATVRFFSDGQGANFQWFADPVVNL